MSSSAADVEALIYREASLLDAKAFDEWLSLLTEDVLYWMPLARDQQEDDVHMSLFYEDLFLLRVRIERLKRPRVFSQQPPSFSQHVLQKPSIEAVEGGFESCTPFIYLEAQLDEQIVLGGTLHHEIVDTPDGLRIRRRRVELLNRQAALPSIQLFI